MELALAGVGQHRGQRMLYLFIFCRLPLTVQYRNTLVLLRLLTKLTSEAKSCKMLYINTVSGSRYGLTNHNLFSYDQASI